MTERQNEIRKPASLPSYLAELEILAGRSVDADELLPVHETIILREKFQSSSKSRFLRVIIPFEKRKSIAFTTMVNQLHALNGSPIVLWPPKANDCGLLQLPSIKDVNFAFPFDLNPEGILVVATSDGLNRMLLDFSDEWDGNRSLEIELHGPHWSQATFPTFE